jgi:hypothetical protein
MNRILASLILVAMPLAGAEWQFSVETGVRSGHAWLWIPPSCQRVRGLILGQQVILEKLVFEHPEIRAVAAQACLAEVLIYPGFDTEFHYDKEHGADRILQRVLDSLASESGYAELAQAPLLPIGHSGSAIFAWNLAYWNPARTIAFIGLHAAAIHPPAWDPKAKVDGVPFLGISGQYESWGNPRQSLEMHWRWLRGTVLEFRAMNERPLMSMIVDPGGGHFSFNPELARYVALFIRKAAQYRLTDAAGKLRDLPLESGWLTDSTFLTPSRFAPAPYPKYKGDVSLAIWHMDEELARAAEAFGASRKGKLDQRVTFVQDGTPVPAAWLEDVKFAPEADGVTLKLHAAFLSETPAGVADSGKPLGHASGPILFSLIGGWAGGGVQTGPDTFRIQPSHFGLTDNIMVLAYHPGGGKYAWAEQPCQIKFPRMLTEGKEQKIDFPAPANVAVTHGKLELRATTDSGLPVEFYVQSGPAELRGTTLQLTAIPPRTKYPVKIRVAAWQRGRVAAPQVKSAEPVFRIIEVNP